MKQTEPLFLRCPLHGDKLEPMLLGDIPTWVCRRCTDEYLLELRAAQTTAPMRLHFQRHPGELARYHHHMGEVKAQSYQHGPSTDELSIASLATVRVKAYPVRKRSWLRRMFRR